ncbi:MAG TPA: glycosyl hydrolase family 28-related protein [Phycisphaerae bacterium]|nr:glycosyl hydrolase family 28-related protein [Phycisphaerae bacterium]
MRLSSFSASPATAPSGTGHSFSIVDFGARPDGQTLCTREIQNAIDACSKAGGGRVIVPAGRFITGPLELRDHIELHLESGAVLEGTHDINLYQVGGYTRGLIYANRANGVAVTGRGTLRGEGTAFMLAETFLTAALGRGRLARRTVGPPSNTAGRLTADERRSPSV